MSAHPLPTATTRLHEVANYPVGATRGLTVLSRLLFGRRNEQDPKDPVRAGIPFFFFFFFFLRPEELPDIFGLADAHHVVIRGLQPFEQMASAAGNRERPTGPQGLQRSARESETQSRSLARFATPFRPKA